jgi:putative endonuclease
MALVYILQSDSGSYYVGSTVDIEKRLKRHNAGTGGRTTRGGTGWKIVYQRSCSTLEEARHEERKIKSWKGGNAFKDLLRKYLA